MSEMASTIIAMPEFFLYMGQERDDIPDDVTRVRVDHSVTRIPFGAFSSLKKLVEVELCEGLEEIGNRAFYECVSLRRITIPSTVLRILNYAFSNCTQLEEVELCEGLLEIGEYAFYKCASLSHIKIPSTVRRIPDCAFYYCEKLEEVELCEGLVEIGVSAFSFCQSLEEVKLCEGLLEIEADAFRLCTSLRHIVIPNTVRAIGGAAFVSTALTSIDLPDSLESIGSFTFCETRLQNMRIPPLITTIPGFTFSSRLFSVELPEELNRIKMYTFQRRRSLRNISIPPNSVIENSAFDGVTDLVKLFASESRIIRELKHRFDRLPIHRMVYYQSYHTAEIALENLNAAIDPRAGLHRKLRSKLNPTGKQQDCLGMTPLHILACSAKQNLALYQLVVQKYPENLITEDKWGALPILYALWGNAPREIIQYLIESYKTRYPALDLSWGRMMETLGRADVPSYILEYVRDVQYEYFPEEEIDWDDVLEKLAEEERSHFNDASEESFKCLIRCSIANRLNAIGVKQWREDIMFMSTALQPRFNRRECLDDIRTKLADYEVGYRRLREATTMLELALWKKEINELNNEKKRQNKKIKLDEAGLRQKCRISCGSDVIIEHVLPYLLPSQNIFVFDVDSHDESSSEDESSSDDES